MQILFHHCLADPHAYPSRRMYCIVPLMLLRTLPVTVTIRWGSSPEKKVAFFFSRLHTQVTCFSGNKFPTSWYLALSLYDVCIRVSQDKWCKFCSIIGLGRPTLLGTAHASVTSYCTIRWGSPPKKKLLFFSFSPSHSGYMFQRKYTDLVNP